MTKNKIPTEEEFARASAALEKRSRGLSQIRDNILCNYAQKYKIHEFFVFDSTETSFRAYIFFKEEKDIKNSEAEGLIEEIKNIIYAQLENAGRGKKNKITVVFEVDSHENVRRKFGGDYFNRLR